MMERIFFRGIVIFCFCLVACNHGAKKEQQIADTSVKTEEQRTFQLPDIPVMLNTPEQRLDYLVQHYWDHFDFCDTTYIHLPDITDQAAVDYMDLLQRIHQDDALEALKGFVEKASANGRMMEYMWNLLSRYWHDPNSPMKNEDLFILLCKSVEQNTRVKEHLREKAIYQRKLAEKNRIGQPAADFIYTLASGKQGRMSDLKAEYTLIFFYDPDCETCSEIKQIMRQSPRLKEMVAASHVKVLTIYPDGDLALWRERLSELDESWVNAYDKDQVLTLEQRYDLSSIPSFYLLDKDKKVLLKDADWRQVMHFLE